jgi:hypothetical protein
VSDRLVAVGWATVDLERPAAGWRRSLATDVLRRGTDPHLGARVAAVDGVGGLVLLEPNTEGRLAASLARHGEGPAALYVRSSRTAAELRSGGIPLSAVDEGPFGPQVLVVGPRFGPHVIVVLDGRPGAPPTDTIEP